MANKGSFAILDASNITYVNKATKKPELYCTYANSYEIAVKTDMVYAKAKGVNRIGFSKGTTGTTKMTTELASTKLFSLLGGSSITTGAGTILKREVFTVAASMDFTLAESSGIILIGAGTVLADGVTEKTSFEVKVGTVAEQGKAVLSSNIVKMYTGDVVEGDVLVIYYLYNEASVDKFTVTAKPSSTYYEIYADASIRYDSDGTDDFVQVHVFKAKTKNDITLTFSADNPSSFTVECDMFGDSAYQVNGVDGMFEWSQIN